MQYKVVEAPVIVSSKDGGGATSLFQALLNKEATGGWKFVSMETITTTQNQGCLFFKQRIDTQHNMIILCKE